MSNLHSAIPRRDISKDPTWTSALQMVHQPLPLWALIQRPVNLKGKWLWICIRQLRWCWSPHGDLESWIPRVVISDCPRYLFTLEFWIPTIAAVTPTASIRSSKKRVSRCSGISSPPRLLCKHFLSLHLRWSWTSEGPRIYLIEICILVIFIATGHGEWKNNPAS